MRRHLIYAGVGTPREPKHGGKSGGVHLGFSIGGALFAGEVHWNNSTFVAIGIEEVEMVTSDGTFPKVRILICSSMGRGKQVKAFWRP
jgi:hypothetical protein